MVNNKQRCSKFLYCKKTKANVSKRKSEIIMSFFIHTKVIIEKLKHIVLKKNLHFICVIVLYYAITKQSDFFL